LLDDAEGSVPVYPVPSPANSPLFCLIIAGVGTGSTC
jgi:hypothetical protein